MQQVVALDPMCVMQFDAVARHIDLTENDRKLRSGCSFGKLW